ncbi:MAG: DUF1003 domain-containing protein [Pseudomonadota bacterium]|nr:DUF1003 domain-containing protein [Pseudomonadota bacterium]
MASRGERFADWIGLKVGSWPFIITQTIIIILWVTANSIHGWSHWDTYPFILLNLGLSLQAAYTGPVLLISANRQAQKDRQLAQKTEEEARATLLKSIEINTECHRIMKLFLLETRRLKQLINTLQEKQ